MEPLALYVGEKNVSSWSMRAWIALRHKGLPFEERPISLLADRDRAERRKVSPTGRVPVLHLGATVVPDSLAIVEYLEETFPPPAHPGLWPADRERRAHARWLAATMNSSFAELRRSMTFHLCFLPERPEPSAVARAESGEMAALWADALAPHGGPFLPGASGAPDAMFAPAVVRLEAFAVPVSKEVAAWMARVLDASRGPSMDGSGAGPAAGCWRSERASAIGAAEDLDRPLAEGARARRDPRRHREHDRP